MEWMLDTINIESIEKLNKIIPLAGVTSNPTIVKKNGKVDFFEHMRNIRKIIGFEKSLHVQVISLDSDEMMREAESILNQIDEHVFIKIPTTECGVKVMKKLKDQKINITATAIYSTFQAMMAVSCGADYLAPYVNRMQNMDINPMKVIQETTRFIEKNQSSNKILAASFKNIGQVTDAFVNGAEAVTLSPDLYINNLNLTTVDQAILQFQNDWKSLYGEHSVFY